MYTTSPTPTPVRTSPASHADQDAAWLQWRPDTPAEPDVLTVAELTECRCPDLCDRDHANE